MRNQEEGPNHYVVDKGRVSVKPLKLEPHARCEHETSSHGTQKGRKSHESNIKLSGKTNQRLTHDKKKQAAGMA